MPPPPQIYCTLRDIFIKKTYFFPQKRLLHPQGTCSMGFVTRERSTCLKQICITVWFIKYKIRHLPFHKLRRWIRSASVIEKIWSSDYLLLITTFKAFKFMGFSFLPMKFTWCKLLTSYYSFAYWLITTYIIISNLIMQTPCLRTLHKL